MPFTLSHPAAAAVLRPLARDERLPLAALAIGTMAPDLEFFLHLRPLSLWSHSLPGLVGFCLPAGLVVLLAWEALVRDPVRHLLALLPAPRARATRRAALAWWLRAGAAILLGAATHLLWDGFTHGNHWGAELLPALRAPALSVLGRQVPWFNLLQHLSTLVGGIVVLGWLGRELHRAGALATIARSPWRGGVLVAIAATTLAVGLWNGSRWERAAADYWGAQLLVGYVAVGALFGLGVALLGFGAAHRYRGRAVAGARAA